MHTQALIAAKADIERADSNEGAAGQRTPCYVAAQAEKPECLELLMNASADFMKVNKTGTSPLVIARATRHHECSALLSLATLDLPVEVLQEQRDGEDMLKWTGTEPLQELLDNEKELIASSKGTRFACALPWAFARMPLDTCLAVVALVSAYREGALRLNRTDEKSGMELLQASMKVQQVLIGLLETLDADEFSKTLLPINQDTFFLERAVGANCNVLLAYSRLQTMLDERWNLTLPHHIFYYAQSQWYEQDQPSEVPGMEHEAGGANARDLGKNLKSFKQLKTRRAMGFTLGEARLPTLMQELKRELPKRSPRHPAPTLLALYARFGLAVFLNLVAFLIEAIFPPFKEWLREWIESKMRHASENVIRRNPKPEWKGEEGKGEKAFLIDGVVMGTALQARPPQEEHDEELRWKRQLAAIAEDEARMVEFYVPLFQPLGCFMLHAVTKLMLAAFITVLPGAGEVTATWLTFLLIWVLQLLINELDGMIFKRTLWLQDVFNAVELVSFLLLTVGLLQRLYSKSLHIYFTEHGNVTKWGSHSEYAPPPPPANLPRNPNPDVNRLRIPRWMSPRSRIVTLSRLVCSQRGHQRGRGGDRLAGQTDGRRGADGRRDHLPRAAGAVNARRGHLLHVDLPVVPVAAALVGARPARAHGAADARRRLPLRHPALGHLLRLRGRAGRVLPRRGGRAQPAAQGAVQLP